MNAVLDSIEVNNYKSHKENCFETIFWFVVEAPIPGTVFSLYVSRWEGARVIKRLRIKPEKISKVERKKESIVLHLK